MSKKTQYSVSNYYNERVMRWHWQKLKARYLARQGK
nr:MAG TPA: anticodon nuclease activator family protein [Caudoviricetes sp.]